MKNERRIALVDDHKLFRKGMVELINRFQDYTVTIEAANGDELINQLSDKNLPHLILLDINMPKMDGYQTAEWLSKNHPDIKILALSMRDKEMDIIKMLKAGAKGYILKDIDPIDFHIALNEVLERGFYYSELVGNLLLNNLQLEEKLNLKDKEIEFLRLVCSEMTYKEIAAEMQLSPRSVDGYRDVLFEKLEVKNRVGLVLFAIRNGIFHLD